MRKEYEKNRLMIWTVIIVVLAIYGITNREIRIDLFKAPEIRESRTFYLETIDNVQMSLLSSDVVMKVHNNDYVLVEIYSQYEKNGRPTVIQDGNIIKIEEKESLNNGFRMKSSQIKVYIPKDSVLDYTILTTSGNVDLFNIQSNSFKTKTTSGDIQFINHQGELVELVTTSGDVNGDIVANDCIVTTTSGDIMITSKTNKGNNVQNPKIHAETSSGEIELDIENISMLEVSSISGDISGKIGTDSLLSKTTSGDIQLEFHRLPEKGIKADTISGEVLFELPNNSGFKLDFSTVSGKVYNDFTGLEAKGTGTNNYKSGEHIIHVTTTSGDIFIEN